MNVLLFVFLFLLTPGLWAAPTWQVILSDANKRIELDSTSIVRNGEQVDATGRVILTRPLIDQKSNAEYRIIEAATRYHCDKKTASTLRRIYKKNENEIVREEHVNIVELPVRNGTLDNKVLSEVCRLKITQTEKKSTVNEKKISKNQIQKPQTPEQNAQSIEKDIRPQFAKPKRQRTKKTATSLPEQKQLQELQNVAQRLKIANEKLLQQELSKTKALAQKSKMPKENPAHKIENNAILNWHKKVAQSVHHKQGEQKGQTAEIDNFSSIFKNKHADWTYGGHLGPAHWADLKKEYRICRDGLRQSPIDIRSSIKGDLPKLLFNYQNSRFRLLDLGFTLSVELENAGFLELDKQRYHLKSAQFRRPGEEMMMGKRFDMSLHLMHQNEEGQGLIVAILLEKGKENSTIQTLWNALPLERNENANTLQFIDFSNIFPRNLDYFTYMGSLTFPPCTENVQWVILKESQSISDEQIQNFAFLYPENARPLQTDNARIVKESR